jgi:hypothetical protein
MDAIMVGTEERAFSLKEELTPCSVDSIEVSNGGDVIHAQAFTAEASTSFVVKTNMVLNMEIWFERGEKN